MYVTVLEFHRESEADAWRLAWTSQHADDRVRVIDRRAHESTGYSDIHAFVVLETETRPSVEPHWGTYAVAGPGYAYKVVANSLHRALVAWQIWAFRCALDRLTVNDIVSVTSIALENKGGVT